MMCLLPHGLPANLTPRPGQKSCGTRGRTEDSGQVAAVLAERRRKTAAAGFTSFRYFLVSQRLHFNLAAAVVVDVLHLGG